MHECRFTAGGADGVDGRPAVVVGRVDDDDAGTFVREQQRRGAAHAVPCAGDERGLVGESRHGRMLP